MLLLLIAYCLFAGLLTWPCCLLLKFTDAGRWPLTPEPDGSYFIDRDPKDFSLVLQCLRGDSIDADAVSLRKLIAFRGDVDYYGLPVDLIKKCLGRDIRSIKPGAMEKWSSRDHLGGILVRQNNALAVHNSSEGYEWAMGANTYSRNDHVVITMRIQHVGDWIFFGAACQLPTSASPCNSSCVFGVSNWWYRHLCVADSHSARIHSTGKLIHITINPYY